MDLTFKRNCGYNKHLSHFVREDVPLTYTAAATKESQNLLQSKPNVDQDMEEEEDELQEDEGSEA